MKNTSIKSVKQLPTWYKLKNYDVSKGFSASEWYDELMPRFCLRHYFKKYKKIPVDLPGLNWEGIKQEGLLFNLAKTGVKKFRIKSLAPSMYEFEVVKEKPMHDELTPIAVISLSNFDMYGAYWLDEETAQAEISKKMEALITEEQDKVSDILQLAAMAWATQPFLDFPVQEGVGLPNKFAYAKVDLSASDEQIKKEFTVWLEQERQRRNKAAPKKNFNQADFDGWYESSVLPYLDLMFWAELEGVKINQYTIAQAIFADAYASDVDPLGKLKTTKKKADYLMDGKVMKLLKLQIAT